MPFKPLTISFDDIKYFVPTPPGMRAQGVTDERLQLLSGVTGAFRPGVLTALVGVSGAGKTTFMDVLAGRKTGGDIEGEIRIAGFPKVQATFARVSGYCEQNDIHSPQVTVRESLVFSAWLRLPSEIPRTRMVSSKLGSNAMKGRFLCFNNKKRILGSKHPPLFHISLCR